MFRPWLGFALTSFLCALTLPFLAISLIVAGLCTAPRAIWTPFRRLKRARDSEIQAAWRSNEFAFERAIEAYEELIDAHAWRRL